MVRSKHVLLITGSVGGPLVLSIEWVKVIIASSTIFNEDK